ncbi:MAG TPA: sialidase family protein [Polyangia bacterium]|jgi:hypothetical protein|nr:sialidase family protein [Polyangia bacterium]
MKCGRRGEAARAITFALVLVGVGVSGAACSKSGGGHEGGAGTGGNGGSAGGAGNGAAGTTGSAGSAGSSGSAGAAGSSAGTSGTAGSASPGTDGAAGTGSTQTDGGEPETPPGTGARFVIVGAGGRRLSSDDGKTWTEAPIIKNPPWANGATVTPTTGDDAFLMRGVCWGNGLFVAVGGNGKDGLVLTSTDGRTWSMNPKSMPNDGCAYGNGLFATERRFSTDGVNWQPVVKGPKSNRVIKFYQGKFVAVGTIPGNVSYSTDGKTWTELPITYKGASDSDQRGYRELAVGNGHFYAMSGCCSRNDYHFFEWDGASDNSFTETPLSQITGADHADGVIYGNGRVILEGVGFYYERLDGSKTWTKHTFTPTKDIYGKANYRPLDIAAYWNGLFTSAAGWTTDLVKFNDAAPLQNNQWTGAQPELVRIVARP